MADRDKALAARGGERTLPFQGPGLLFETRRDGLAFLVFDRPGEKVNVLDGALVAVLEILLQQAARDKNVRGLVVTSAKPGSFIAGADVNAIRALRTAHDAEDVSRRGQRLWDSGTAIGGAVYAPPIAVNGRLYVAAWDGRGGGDLYAFGI